MSISAIEPTSKHLQEVRWLATGSNRRSSQSGSRSVRLVSIRWIDPARGEYRVAGPRLFGRGELESPRAGLSCKTFSTHAKLIPRNGQEQCGRRFCAFLRHEMKDSHSSRNRGWDVRGDPGGVTQQARGHLLWSHVICQERLQIPWLFLAYSVHQSAATLGNGKRVGACGKYLHGRRMGSKKRFPSRCGK